MTIMQWAIDVPRWSIQKDAKMRILANPLKQTKYGLQSETRLYEKVITSNREILRHGEYSSQTGTNHSSGAERSVRNKFGYCQLLVKLLGLIILATNLRMRDFDQC